MELGAERGLFVSAVPGWVHSERSRWGPATRGIFFAPLPAGKGGRSPRVPKPSRRGLRPRWKPTSEAGPGWSCHPAWGRGRVLGFLPLAPCLPRLSPRLPHCPGSGPGCTELPAGCRRGAREGSDPPHPTAPASEPTAGLREGPGGDPGGDPGGAAAPCPRRLEVDGVRMAECKGGAVVLEGRCRGSALGTAQKMLGAASGMEGEIGRCVAAPAAAACVRVHPGTSRRCPLGVFCLVPPPQAGNWGQAGLWQAGGAAGRGQHPSRVGAPTVPAQGRSGVAVPGQ